MSIFSFFGNRPKVEILRPRTSKVSYFFFTRKRLKFAPFCGFSSEWVKMVFFFPTLFFFPALWNRVSEWRVNFSWEKKKQLLAGKKKQRKKMKFDKRCRFLPFLTFFWRFTVSQLSEWLANFSWEKKNSLFFFSKTREKKTKIAQSEWVSTPQSFPGKKNDTFG